MLPCVSVRAKYIRKIDLRNGEGWAPGALRVGSPVHADYAFCVETPSPTTYPCSLARR